MKRLPSSKTPPPKFCRLLSLSIATTVLLPTIFFGGCSSMDDRAVAMNKLTPADQHIAKQGDIKNGFSKDAVYAAWGTPSKTSIVNTRQGVRECWTYVRTFNGYGGGYYGVSRGLMHGKNGDHYDTDDFYPGPSTSDTLGGTPTTDVPVKRAIFENGHVVSYETAKSTPHDDEGRGSYE